MVAAVVTVVVTVTPVIPANQLAMRCPASTMLMRRLWPLFWPGAESDVHCCAVALPRLSCLREVRSGAAGGRLPQPLAGSRTMQQGSGKGMCRRTLWQWCACRRLTMSRVCLAGCRSVYVNKRGKALTGREAFTRYLGETKKAKATRKAKRTRAAPTAMESFLQLNRTAAAAGAGAAAEPAARRRRKRRRR